jgi:Short C-terminal domain
MFMRRRRPLARAAMIGGAGYMAGKAGQRHAQAEQDQDAQIADLQDQQAAPPAPAPAAPAPPAGDDMVTQLKQLGDLKASGVLTDEEFDAAKAKLIAS